MNKIYHIEITDNSDLNIEYMLEGRSVKDIENKIQKALRILNFDTMLLEYSVEGTIKNHSLNWMVKETE